MAASRCVKIESITCNNFEMIRAVLKRVTRKLLDGKMPPDDTIMHNFLDCLKQNGFSTEDIIKTELDSFANSVVKKYDQYDSSIVSFAINIQGWLVEDTEFYNAFSQNVQETLSRICRDINSCKLCETVILASFFDCLIPLSTHKGGIMWIVDEGVIVAGLKLLRSCPSIFLEKSIIDFICCVVDQLGCISTDCLPVFEYIHSNIDDLVKQKTSSPFAAASLKLLEKLSVHKPELQKYLLTSHSSIINSLVLLLTQPYSKNSDAVLRIIGDIYKQWSEKRDFIESKVMEDFISHTDNILSDLINNESIEQAQKLAACCLEMKLPDNRLCIKCCQVHLEPVGWMFDRNKDLNLISEKILSSVIKDRRRCVSIVCQALDSHVLPVTMVMKILGCTLRPDEHIDVTISSYIFNNTKIQTKCLECLIYLNNTTKSGKDSESINEEQTLSVCKCLLNLYRKDECYSMISSLCVDLLIQHLPCIICDVKMSQELSDIIQHHLSALKWELRDNTVELVGKIVSTYKDNVDVVEWLVKNRLSNLIWFSLKDTESYVRATAISTLLTIIQCSQLYDDLKHSTSLTEDDVLMEIINIVKTDTEAFARRSAMKFLCEFFKARFASSERYSPHLMPWLVVECIVVALKDFDWEVKITGLEYVLAIFTDLMFNRTERKNCSGLLKVKPYKMDRNISYMADILQYQNLDTVLIGTLDDYDDTVCEKSLQVFTEIQSGLINIVHEFDISMFDVDESSCDKTSAVKDGPSSNKKMKCCNCPKTNNETDRTLSSSYENSNNGVIASNGIHSNGKIDKCNIHSDKHAIETLKKIVDIDLTLYQKRLNHTQDNVTTLLSLSEDILSYTTTLCDGEEKISDCY